MIFAKRFAILFLVSAFFYLGLCPSQARYIAPEWIVTQNEETFGECVIYVWHNGAKVLMPKLGCDLVCKAPDWKVHCFNRKEKTEWIGELSMFSGLAMANPFAPVYCKIVKLREIGSDNFNGLKQTKFCTPDSPQDVLATTSEIPVASEIGEFLSRLYSIPKTSFIPLFRICDRGKGGKLERYKAGSLGNSSANDLREGLVKKLVTKSWRQVAFCANDFDIPKGFVRKKDIIQVSYSAGRKEELGSFLNELGFKTRSKP